MEQSIPLNSNQHKVLNLARRYAENWEMPRPVDQDVQVSLSDVERLAVMGREAAELAQRIKDQLTAPEMKEPVPVTLTREQWLMLAGTCVADKDVSESICKQAGVEISELSKQMLELFRVMANRPSFGNTPPDGQTMPVQPSPALGIV